jgi:hypothetical protein
MHYSELVSEIIRFYPNHYRKHYMEHMTSGSFWHRMNIASGLATEINEHFVVMQRDGYTVEMSPRPVELPPRQSGQAIELLTDFALANYHLRGLSLKREASGQADVNEEYPPLGEGAREYLERCFVGVPINLDERRRTKTCEVCESPFIDKSRNKMAKVCGQTCRDRKDALRQRERYNESELGLKNEKRLKRYRERQDLEYPFYSPLEIYELSNRSEIVAEEKKIDAVAYKQDVEFDQQRFNGKRKPMYVGRDEFDKKPFSYRPVGREKLKVPSFWWSDKVEIRKIGVDVSTEQLEAEKFVDADKMRGGMRIQRQYTNYTLEKHAI